MGDRIRPFHCGSQAADWMDQNCDSCFKGYDHDAGRHHCDIQEAVDVAWIGDGTVSAEIATRMGVNAETRLAYSWRCGEFSAAADGVETWHADLPGQQRMF